MRGDYEILGAQFREILRDRSRIAVTDRSVFDARVFPYSSVDELPFTIALILLLPIIMLCMKGWPPVIGLALLIVDVVIARTVVKFARQVRRRDKLTQTKFEVIAAGAVVISCATLHALLLFGVQKIFSEAS